MNVPDALNHPVRRQILRTLIDSDGAQKPGEIVAAGLPDTNVSVVGYHARVLEGAEIVRRTDSGPADDEAAYRAVAGVAEDPEVAALLEATRDSDLGAR
jgi:DNA-binding transcriptional ArsR family regulator